MFRQALKFAARLCWVFLGLILLVEVVGNLTWLLSGAGQIPLEDLDKITEPQRHPTEAKAVHSVAEWPSHRGRKFNEAPSLRLRVEAGDLPPVAERLPEDPLVIVPPHQIGPYGGTWRRFATGPSDIRTVVTGRITYDGLFRWGPMGQKILPNLAVRWKVEDQGRTYTIWLRKGVRWSDGHPFTVDDILFWYEGVLLNRDITPVLGPNLTSGGEPARLEKIDDYTIRFRFKEPKGLFLKRCASSLGLAMVEYPVHYLKQFHPRYVPKEQLEQMARTAGFEFWFQLFLDKAYWQNTNKPHLWAWIVKDPPPAQPVMLERNPYYWKVDPEGNQLPYIDRVAFDIFNVETINLKAINGELGMQPRHLQFENYPLLMENSRKGGYRVLHWIDSAAVAIALAPNLNHKDPVRRKLYNDRRFRIALSHAINRSEIKEACFLGIGKPRQVCPPPASPYYVPTYESAYVEYDPDKANRLLDEIGLDKRNHDGWRLRADGKVLHIDIETSSTMINNRALELVAEYWRSIGIHTDVRLRARQLYFKRVYALLHDVGSWHGGDDHMPVVDPRWYLPVHEGSIQAVGYGRWFRTGGKQGLAPSGDLLRAIELYRQIRRTPEEDEQIRLFGEIIELNRKNLWVIGTVGQVPKIVVVDEDFRNVPEVAVYGYICRTPGNTATECYAIERRQGK